MIIEACEAHSAVQLSEPNHQLFIESHVVNLVCVLLLINFLIQCMVSENNSRPGIASLANADLCDY